MLIDGFTLIAQLVNFLVLIWLLKRFLYKPILNAIAEREQYIAMQIHQADAKKADADKELETAKRVNDEFEQQRQSMLNKAMNDVDTERLRLMDDMHNEMKALQAAYEETLQTEQQSLSSEIVQRTQTGVFDIARKTLSDLASVNLEMQMVDAFLTRLNTLKSDERELLFSNFKLTQNMVIVQSSFELPLALKTRIETDIRIGFEIEPEIKFETDASLISGIALIVGGYKVVWSIDEYLHLLKNNLTGLIKEKYQNITSTQAS